jgi:hypothetical protein
VRLSTSEAGRVRGTAPSAASGGGGARKRAERSRGEPEERRVVSRRAAEQGAAAENQRTTPSGRMKGVFKPRNLATDCHGPFPKPGLTPYPRQVFDLTVELRKEQSRRKVLEQKFENVRLMPQVRDCSCKTFWPNRLLSAPMLAWKLVRSELTWAAHRRKLQWIANDIWRARCVRTWRNT